MHDEREAALQDGIQDLAQSMLDILTNDDDLLLSQVDDLYAEVRLPVVYPGEDLTDAIRDDEDYLIFTRTVFSAAHLTLAGMLVEHARQRQVEDAVMDTGLLVQRKAP